MTDRQRHKLCLLADPCNRRSDLHDADREAIQAAINDNADLLAACKAIVRWYDEAKSTGHGYTPVAEMAAMLAAIRRAEGGER